MDDSLNHLREAVRKHAACEGPNPTGIPGVTAYRHTGKAASLPTTLNPSLYLVADGVVRIDYRDQPVEVLPGRFVIGEMDTPLAGWCPSATLTVPTLALAIEFSLDEVMSVLLDIDSDLPKSVFHSADGEPSGQDDARLLDGITRLLRADEAEHSLPFMVKHLKREIIFYVITGPRGKRFVTTIASIQRAADIYYVNSWIKQHYKESFTVQDLAQQSSMSLSSFHQKFKSAVHMGPLQCQKQLRLTEARRLMVDRGATVTEAALDVGYESVSQFTRDYKRFFGNPPTKDLQRLQGHLDEIADTEE
ncbi:helix-turn-helix domain-containing protein [Streptomyces sp. NPDC048219]|uniref:helix-turn-helix domain-containing protein n=1 Tax=Streptomyces TaxID=1883 RepID=UPI00371B3720